MFVCLVYIQSTESKHKSMQYHASNHTCISPTWAIIVCRWLVGGRHAKRIMICWWGTDGIRGHWLRIYCTQHGEDAADMYPRAWHVKVRSQRWACLVIWFCYQIIAKPGNKTGTPLFKKRHTFVTWPIWTIYLNDYSWTLCGPLIPYRIVSDLCRHWFRQWIGTCLVPSHYLSQC